MSNPQLDTQLTGTLIHIGDVQELGSNGFTKRVIVIRIEDGEYPQEIPLELFKDKTALADRFKIGDLITADVNLRGNEGKGNGAGRWYVQFVAWQIQAHEGKSETNNAAPAEDGLKHTKVSADKSGEDFPF